MRNKKNNYEVLMTLRLSGTGGTSRNRNYNTSIASERSPEMMVFAVIMIFYFHERGWQVGSE